MLNDNWLYNWPQIAAMQKNIKLHTLSTEPQEDLSTHAWGLR